MASFDFQSGLAGAQTGGSMGGGYGAIAGFVIGGFMGGRAKKRAQKKEKKRQKQLKHLASPTHLAETTKELTPQFRQQIAGGAGAAMTGAIQTGVARRGLTGTGIGTALTAGAAAVPETMAFKEALGQAEGVINRQIEAKKGQAIYEPEDVAGEIGQVGDAYSLFKQLSAGSAGQKFSQTSSNASETGEGTNDFIWGNDANIAEDAGFRDYSRDKFNPFAGR